MTTAEQLATTVSGGEWVAPGLRSGAVPQGGTRPAQRLATAGLGDLVSLIEPIQQAVDRMVVDGSVAAFTEAVQRAGTAVEEVGREFVRTATAGEAEWTGDAGDRYRERAKAVSEALAGVSRLLAAGGAAAKLLGTAVGSARAQADALLDHCVTQLISYVQMAMSVQGGNSVAIRAEAASLVASYARPVADLEQMLRQTAGQLAGASGVGQAAEVLAGLREAFVLPTQGSSDFTHAAGGVSVGDPLLIKASFDGGTGGTGDARNVQVAAAGGWRNTWRPNVQKGKTPGGRPGTQRPGSIGRPVGSPGSAQKVTGRKTDPFDLSKLRPTPKNKPGLDRSKPKDREEIQEAAEEIHHQLEETLIDLTNGMRDEVAHDLANVRKNYPADWTTERVIGTETDKRVGQWVTDNHNSLIDPDSGWRMRTQVAFMNPEAEVPWSTDRSKRPDLILEREIPNPKWNGGANSLPQYGHEVVTVYDVKTGDKGITDEWARDVKRKFDPLFEPVEIHPDRGMVDRSSLRSMRIK
ncbi:hypothetical protein JNUCC0626_11570 [Lentzea sp. JNUCC 0626]|uniref:hypothetical protein n=1 Tax=Lentzea sp. JNUCC 0626 TaxID=3367513 RepID=UPI003749E044